jgi:hypothetical protein
MPKEPEKTEDQELEDAKELFKEGLRKIYEATKKVSRNMVESFREGYAKDVTKKGDEGENSEGH